MFLRTFVLALPMLLLPAVAHAQAITIVNQTALGRVDARGAPIAKRPVSQSPEGVSRSDCDHDQKIRFPLMLSGFAANATLSAWSSVAGVDCAQPTNRANGLCTALELALPLASTLVVDVPVRRLVASASADADARACGEVDLTNLDVQFLYVPPGAEVPAAKASTAIVIDTVGPEPPKELRARSGNGRLVVEWAPLEGVGGVVGVTAFCDASPSSALRAGVVPTSELDAKLRCADVVGAAVTSLAVSEKPGGAPLTNDEPVVIAVSATDAFGNRGPLSPPITTTPTPTAEPDATEGGGCSSAPARPDAGAGVLLLLGVFAVGSRARRSASVRGGAQRRS